MKLATDIIAILAQLATIALVGGVFFAWRNVETLGADSTMRLNRAAKEKAIEAATMYLKSHVKEFDDLYARAGAEKFTSYDGNIGDFSPESLDKKGMASG